MKNLKLLGLLALFCFAISGQAANATTPAVDEIPVPYLSASVVGAGSGDWATTAVSSSVFYRNSASNNTDVMHIPINIPQLYGFQRKSLCEVWFDFEQTHADAMDADPSFALALISRTAGAATTRTAKTETETGCDSVSDDTDGGFFRCVITLSTCERLDSGESFVLEATLDRGASSVLTITGVTAVVF